MNCQFKKFQLTQHYTLSRTYLLVIPLLPPCYPLAIPLLSPYYLLAIGLLQYNLTLPRHVLSDSQFHVSLQATMAAATKKIGAFNYTLSLLMINFAPRYRK